MAITNIQIYETATTMTNPHGPDSTGFSRVPDPDINARGTALDAGGSPLLIFAVRIRADNLQFSSKVATQCSGPGDGQATPDQRFVVPFRNLAVTAPETDILRFTDTTEASVDITLDVVDDCVPETPCSDENPEGYPLRTMPHEEFVSAAKGEKDQAFRVLTRAPGKVQIIFPVSDFPFPKVTDLFAVAKTAKKNDLLSAIIWQLKDDGTIDPKKEPISPCPKVERLGRFAIFHFPVKYLPKGGMKLVVHSAFIGPGSVKFKIV